MFNLQFIIFIIKIPFILKLNYLLRKTPEFYQKTAKRFRVFSGEILALGLFYEWFLADFSKVRIEEFIRRKCNDNTDDDNVDRLCGRRFWSVRWRLMGERWREVESSKWGQGLEKIKIMDFHNLSGGLPYEMTGNYRVKDCIYRTLQCFFI